MLLLGHMVRDAISDRLVLQHHLLVDVNLLACTVEVSCQNDWLALSLQALLQEANKPHHAMNKVLGRPAPKPRKHATKHSICAAAVTSLMAVLYTAQQQKQNPLCFPTLQNLLSAGSHSWVRMLCMQGNQDLVQSSPERQTDQQDLRPHNLPRTGQSASRVRQLMHDAVRSALELSCCSGVARTRRTSSVLEFGV